MEPYAIGHPVLIGQVCAPPGSKENLGRNAVRKTTVDVTSSESAFLPTASSTPTSPNPELAESINVMTSL